MEKRINIGKLDTGMACGKSNYFIDCLSLKEYFGKYEIDEGDVVYDETKEDVRVIPVITTQWINNYSLTL